jgi:hypothetical protein
MRVLQIFFLMGSIVVTPFCSGMQWTDLVTGPLTIHNVSDIPIDIEIWAIIGGHKQRWLLPGDFFKCDFDVTWYKVQIDGEIPEIKENDCMTERRQVYTGSYDLIYKEKKVGRRYILIPQN